MDKIERSLVDDCDHFKNNRFTFSEQICLDFFLYEKRDDFLINY